MFIDQRWRHGGSQQKFMLHNSEEGDTEVASYSSDLNVNDDTTSLLH